MSGTVLLTLDTLLSNRTAAEWLEALLPGSLLSAAHTAGTLARGASISF